MAELRASSWISGNKLGEIRALICTCPNEDFREAGMACLRGRKTGEYLANLIPQDHPDRIAIVRYLTKEER